jgi:hypothetical protein
MECCEKGNNEKIKLYVSGACFDKSLQAPDLL